MNKIVFLNLSYMTITVYSQQNKCNTYFVLYKNNNNNECKQKLKV